MNLQNSKGSWFSFEASGFLSFTGFLKIFGRDRLGKTGEREEGESLREREGAMRNGN